MSAQANNRCIICGETFHATYPTSGPEWQHWKEVAESANACTLCQINKPQVGTTQGKQEPAAGEERK